VRISRRPVLVAALAAASLTAGGCGSGGKSTQTTTQASQAEAWAGSVCTAVLVYQQNLNDTAAYVKNGDHSKNDLQQGAYQVKKATHAFVGTLEGLGKPGTAGGQTVKTTLDGLRAELQKDLHTIQGAQGDSAAEAVSVASTALVTAQSQIKTAVKQIQQADPKGDLRQAFSQASSCAPLSKS